MATTNAGDAILALGVELLVLGIATGVAGISDEVGTIMVVFMIGLLLAWMMSHTLVLRAIPNLLNYSRSKGVG